MLGCSHLGCGCMLSRENRVEGVGCGLTVPNTRLEEDLEGFCIFRGDRILPAFGGLIC